MMSRYRDAITGFYDSHPRSISSPFGGVGGEPYGSNPYLDEVLKVLRVDVRNRRVLDIGCGAGWFARYCKEKAAFYTGIDLSSASIALTRTVTPRVIRADADTLPLRSKTFEYIFYIDSFEHTRDQEYAAREARRLLVNGGRVFLSVPNYSNVCGIVKVLAETLGPYERNTWAPFDRWTPQALEHFMTPWRVRSVFERAGFRRFRMVGGYRDFLDGVFPWIDHPAMRGVSLARKLFAPFERALTRIFPVLSLHTFWSIEK